MGKNTRPTDDAEKDRHIAYLHRLAKDTRKTAAEFDQWANRMQERLHGPPSLPIPCCTPGPCMVCGANSPPGHMHVELPDSFTSGRRITIGRMCSSHTFWDVARTGRFMVTIEG